ncbi:MAG TPA: PSD1 and planctomycete cytochrome C domain-containing protein [Fimbriiglobus sp.]|nr:PSD1 and planctomycete cytochrome C domain-containing protein [Fimbriiglobus sp.]
MPRPIRLGLWWLLAAVSPSAAADPVSTKPDFNRDVRPILSDRCFKCHGPATQKGKIRLDALIHATKRDAVIPCKPGESGVIDRVTAAANEDRMPPPEAGPRLTPAQVDVLKRWIEHGAEYAPHWAFVPPHRPEIPGTKSQIPTRNPIDAFVFARLEKEGLKPSPDADRAALIRRVYLDLTGLLPSPAEVETFVADKSPDAYEKVVDSLLASPHYGERQARHWLDLARYADSNGYTVDGARSMWPYRDWVVRAFNDDMPFDQFTIEQLAGDLLPNPTVEQKVATGFHRNTPFNEEGGTDPEQFRAERTVDRANTTAAVWLGLTAACAQCHDHKYDPITQKDYYRLYAFFNSCDEPTLPVGGDPELTARVNELMAKSNKLKSEGKLEEGQKVDAEIKKVAKKVPTTLVMSERKVPRESFVHVRGDFLRKGDKVTPGYPSALSTASPPVATKGLLTRLDLARWLVSPENSLTARVTVNRYWQQFFGAGLVDTENDFGMQGSPPTHAGLLDWLAVEFREGGWSPKKLHRLIVTSATYRQSSVARPDLKAKDPQNKLLGRQNRLRLEAEIIRDAALSASGLLSRKEGGPGVYPPMPAEVFSFTQAKKAWPESKGEDRYRRGLYTFIWRQSQHHLLTTFDGADAQTVCTKRNRSNTPLQALHLANDPAFVEFAEGLGKRVVKEGPQDDAGRVDYAFELCFARTPTAEERGRVLKYLESQKKGFPGKAWTMTARVLMNLDEFITRE